eukprot:Selendium_serpulae@DN4149_c0_g1_i1.p1
MPFLPVQIEAAEFVDDAVDAHYRLKVSKTPSVFSIVAHPTLKDEHGASPMIITAQHNNATVAMIIQPEGDEFGTVFMKILNAKSDIDTASWFMLTEQMPRNLDAEKNYEYFSTDDSFYFFNQKFGGVITPIAGQTHLSISQEWGSVGRFLACECATGTEIELMNVSKRVTDLTDNHYVVSDVNKASIGAGTTTSIYVETSASSDEWHYVFGHDQKHWRSGNGGAEVRTDGVLDPSQNPQNYKWQIIRVFHDSCTKIECAALE